MRCFHFACLGAVVAAAACNDSSTRPVSQLGSELPVFFVQGQNTNLRDLNSDERRIIDELAQLYPAGESQVRALLNDRRVASIEVNDLRAQVLLRRLDSIRRVSTETIQAARVSVTAMATVLLVDSLPADKKSNAIVIRRLSPPADFIVLQERDAKGAALGAGIAALFRLRKEFGDEPHANVRLVIENGHMPKRWSPLLKDQAEQIVRQLRTATKQQVQGFGLVRRTEIPLRRVHPATSALAIVR